MKDRKNLNWERQSNRQFKARRRSNEVAIKTGGAKPTPFHVKVARRAQLADVTTLFKWEERLTNAAVYYLRAFTEWRAEAPEAMTVEDWPDRPKMIEVARSYDVIAQVLKCRKVPFTPRQITMPSAAYVPKVNTTEVLQTHSPLRDKVTGLLGKLFGKKKESSPISDAARKLMRK